jgi:hypothetical protein
MKIVVKTPKILELSHKNKTKLSYLTRTELFITALRFLNEFLISY